MPYSTHIKSMHIACILCCRFCRHCKATKSVQSHRFCVSWYKHNGAYFTHCVTFKPSYDSYALHTSNLLPSIAIGIIHLRALWVSAQRCASVCTDKW